MNAITIMENQLIQKIKDNWFIHLSIEKDIIEKNFDWVDLIIEDKVLKGTGTLFVNGIDYSIEINYSPFFKFRMDRIYVRKPKLKFNNYIHVYPDLSLCLYHPRIDKPLNSIVPLHKMIPWISEWCHFYQEWKKYRVWLGREIMHRF